MMIAARKQHFEIVLVLQHTVGNWNVRIDDVLRYTVGYKVKKNVEKKSTIGS